MLIELLERRTLLAVIPVTPGQSIQSAINSASSGDTISIQSAAEPYAGFTVNKNNLDIQAAAPASLPTDLNNDQTVDSSDFSLFANAYLKTAAGDFNGDGRTDTIDFNHLAADFGKQLGGSVLIEGFVSGGQFIDYRGLTVQNVRNMLQVDNAAWKIGSNSTMTDCVARDNTGVGIGIQGNNVTLTRVIMERNGQEGFVAINSDTVLLKDCKAIFNNPGLTVAPPWKDFFISGYNAVQVIGGKWYVDPVWEAGGNKIWGVKNLTIDGGEYSNNTGPGVWTDSPAQNIVVKNAWVHHNKGLDAARFYGGGGIMFEWSTSTGGFLAENNRIENNTSAAITLASVHDVTLRGNTMTGNYTGVLFRCDDNRGNIYNVLATGNSYSGSKFVKWGTRGMSNVVIDGTAVT